VEIARLALESALGLAQEKRPIGSLAAARAAEMAQGFDVVPAAIDVLGGREAGKIAELQGRCAATVGLVLDGEATRDLAAL
jgi:hypothetical protein